MDRVSTAWSAVKTAVSTIADGAAASDLNLREINTKADAVETELLSAIDLYSVTTVTTTKIPVDILIPLPITGRWSPGKTMRTATMLARDLINQKQELLPGYEIKLTFMDDECNKET